MSGGPWYILRFSRSSRRFACRTRGSRTSGKQSAPDDLIRAAVSRPGQKSLQFLEISEAALSSNPSFSQFGVGVMNGYFMASRSSILSADVPPFHPGIPPPDHGGFGLGFCFGDVAVGGATAAADIGAQFAPAPAPHGGHLGARTPPEEEMNGGYDVAGGDGSGPASLLCPGQSDAHAIAVWSSSKKPYCDWSNADGSRTVSDHGSYHLAGPPEAVASTTRSPPAIPRRCRASCP